MTISHIEITEDVHLYKLQHHDNCYCALDIAENSYDRVFNLRPAIRKSATAIELVTVTELQKSITDALLDHLTEYSFGKYSDWALWREANKTDLSESEQRKIIEKTLHNFFNENRPFARKRLLRNLYQIPENLARAELKVVHELQQEYANEVHNKTPSDAFWKAFLNRKVTNFNRSFYSTLPVWARRNAWSWGIEYNAFKLAVKEKQEAIDKEREKLSEQKTQLDADLKCMRLEIALNSLHQLIPNESLRNEIAHFLVENQD